MNVLLLALQVMLILPGDTSTIPFPYFIKSPDQTFDWKKHELNISKKYKDSILGTLKEDYVFYFENEYGITQNYAKAFHFVDLNNDHLPDLVYEGWTGSEGTMVQIYLNRQFRLEKVFEDYMRIADWQFVNNRLRWIVIFNYGCCAETVQFERHFQIDSLFNFTLARQRAILTGMDVSSKDHTKPDTYFDHPVAFKTVNDEYSLRYAPEISDKVPDALDEGVNARNGNIIALYPKGSRGIAWAGKTDATGREWWLVEMEPAVFLSFNRFWDYDDKLTYYYGWMSSRFLEKLR